MTLQISDLKLRSSSFCRKFYFTILLVFKVITYQSIACVTEQTREIIFAYIHVTQANQSMVGAVILRDGMNEFE